MRAERRATAEVCVRVAGDRRPGAPPGRLTGRPPTILNTKDFHDLADHEGLTLLIS
jgi:hypothetical protein